MGYITPFRDDTTVRCAMQKKMGKGVKGEEEEKPMRSENGSQLSKRSPVGGALESFGSDLE